MRLEKACQNTPNMTRREREKKLNRTISIFEAALLAIVAVLAAWSGFCRSQVLDRLVAPPRQGERRPRPGQRSQPARLLNSLNFDLTTFNHWFTAYVAGNKTAMAVAEKRFSPNFDRAFRAWLATSPETNPHSRPGQPRCLSNHPPQKILAAKLNAQATDDYNVGEKAGANSDSYVRTTVYLATVLFLAGIGSHFVYRTIRYGLATVGCAILLLAIVLLATAPKPA